MMKLEKRQKIILGLVVLAVIILIWQLYILFGGDSAVSPDSNKPVVVNTFKEVTSPTQVVKSSPAVQAVNNVSSTTPVQQKYLALVNQYQLIEIQRLIAQDQAAIASAQAAAAESLSKVSQSGVDVSSLVSNISTDNQAGDYELIYTGQDNGEWTATLKKNGQFNDVTAGSVLSDGAKVLSVDSNGVLLQEGAIKKLVTFNGISSVSAQTSAPASPDLNPNSALAPSPSSVPSQPDVKLPVPVTSTSAPAASQSLPKMVASNAPVSKTVSVMTDIQKMDKNNYTIQIVADNTAEAIKDFVNDNHLENKAQVIKVWRKSRPWYIAVLGNYATVEQAQKVIRSLPEAVQDEGPFVRQAADVQAEMVK